MNKIVELNQNEIVSISGGGSASEWIKNNKALTAGIVTLIVVSILGGAAVLGHRGHGGNLNNVPAASASSANTDQAAAAVIYSKNNVRSGVNYSYSNDSERNDSERFSDL